MIIRDLYRCPTEDLHKAIAASSQTILRRGVVEPGSAIEPADVEYLAAHPDFDPSLSFVAYDGGEPVAFLVSRIEESEAVWSLFGGVEAAQHALEALLDDTMDHWRREGATRARKGLTGLLGGGPRLSEDAALVDLLKDRGFEIRSTSARMELDLGKRAPPEGLEEREAEMRRKGCFVRAARPEEVLIVARQYHPRHTGEHSQELWNLFVRHLRADALFIAEVRRQVVGYAAYLGWTLEAECPQLGPLHVDEAYRRGGIEGVLVHHAALAAREHGKACVGVHCGPDKVSFYQRAGFAVAARLCHEAVAKL